MSLPVSRLKPEQNRDGFVLLTLLVAVAILLLLYAAYTQNIFHFFAGTEKDRYSDPNAYPWEEGHLFIDDVLDGYDMGGRRPPFPGQPPLKEPLRYTAGVYAGNEPRGEIELYIWPDGDVSGSWSAAYGTRTDRNRYYETVQESRQGEKTNTFRGNTAPLKVYKDDRGEDKSKLYFITKGEFLLQESRENKMITGTIYVTGWVDKNYNAEGELVLLFIFRGEPEIFVWGPAKAGKVE
jgi:hypothetical protein